MDAEFGADQQPDGRREAGVGLHHLWRLLLDYKRTEKEEGSGQATDLAFIRHGEPA